MREMVSWGTNKCLSWRYMNFRTGVLASGIFDLPLSNHRTCSAVHVASKPNLIGWDWG